MSKAKVVLAVLSSSSMAMAGSAFAQAQDSGWYIGAMVGQAEARNFCSQLSGASACDEKDSAWRLLGGYMANRHVGVEVGYTNLGEATATAGGNVTFEAGVWELSALGALPLGRNFSAYGKLGVYYGETDFSAPGASDTDSTNDLTYGLGLQWNMTRNLGVRGEWQRYENVGGTFRGVGAESDVDVLSVGVIWKF